MTRNTSGPSRRGRGEGMIRKRADGRFEARHADASGKRRYLYGPTRKDVHDLLSTGLRQAQ